MSNPTPPCVQAASAKAGTADIPDMITGVAVVAGGTVDNRFEDIEQVDLLNLDIYVWFDAIPRREGGY